MTPETVYRRSPPWARTLMLNAYALRIERHRYGRRYRRAVRTLLELERNRADLDSYQQHHLQRVIATAYERSSYYRQVFDERGLTPADIREPSDLKLLPLLDKDVVRTRGSEILTKPRTSGWLHGHTSGTTGSPLSLWYDRATCIMTNAMDRRQKLWAGAGMDSWTGLLLGRVIVPQERSRPPFWHPNHVQRQVWFSSFHLSDEHLPAYVTEMRRRRLQYLEGYPSTMYILARYLLRRGETLPMRAVFTSSETLLDIQREAIESAFQCRLFDFYGHAERAIFALECTTHDGKHLAEEYGITEVVDEHGQPVPDGMAGFLVGTSLHNTAMPMIRYRTNDMSVVRTEPCSCGRVLKRIASVATKAEDIVVTPDGRMVSPSILTHPFKPFDQILKSQVVQDRVDHLTVRLVTAESFTSEHREQLASGLRERLGAGVTIDIVQVADIPAERSGKFRWVISRVPHGCALSWDIETPTTGTR